MMYKAKVTVCSDSQTKHNRNVITVQNFMNVKPGGMYSNQYAIKR
jgi:hypothetical protein